MISDEALEDAAHAIYSVNRKKEVSERTYEERWPRHRFAYKVLARAALEAAAPDMLAEAWDAAVIEGESCGWILGNATDDLRNRNPYRRNEPLEYVIRDSSGNVLDRWSEPDE